MHKEVKRNKKLGRSRRSEGPQTTNTRPARGEGEGGNLWYWFPLGFGNFVANEGDTNGGNIQTGLANGIRRNPNDGQIPEA
jgi:hypothetical protein